MHRFASDGSGDRKSTLWCYTVNISIASTVVVSPRSIYAYADTPYCIFSVNIHAKTRADCDWWLEGNGSPPYRPATSRLALVSAEHLNQVSNVPLGIIPTIISRVCFENACVRPRYAKIPSVDSNDVRVDPQL